MELERETVSLDAETVSLDAETVEAAAAAATSVDHARQQRVDAALAELARSSAGSQVVEPLAQPAVPSWLSIAPPVIGSISLILFVLNSQGVFGEGPDLDALAAWSSS